MDLVLEFFSRLLTQFQSPALAFLIGGMVLAAAGSKLQIPDAIYKFCVYMLLMRIGLEGGMEIREAELGEMLLPAVIAVIVGCAIVIVGRYTLSALPGVRTEDGIATAGLFGAVSASTLAAAMVMLTSVLALFGMMHAIQGSDRPTRCLVGQSTLFFAHLRVIDMQAASVRRTPPGHRARRIEFGGLLERADRFVVVVPVE